MATKSILLAVSDPELLLQITHTLGDGWETTPAASETEALAQFEKRSFDALLADFNLSSADSTDASDLLNHAAERQPNSTQFLLVHEADLALVAAKVLGSPHILPKPIEPASLKSRIENALKDSNSTPAASEPANIPGEAPKTPPIYSEVLKALESPDVTSEQVGKIIARDAELTAEVLKLTNSSYLHWPGNISRPAEAVESLGFDTVKAIVQALQFLAEHSRLKPGYLSLDEIWQHSIKVGQIARDLMLLETKDRTLASQAFAAGLLHDLGKVVLAMNFQDLYGRVHSLAAKQPVAIWDIEKEMFGASHGEIGACLVGMWNMPGYIVDAAALHHEPPVEEQEQITPLAAVHIANVLEHELRPDGKDMMVSPILNTTFLNQLGLLQRLPVWRAAFANRKPPVESELESAETSPARFTIPSSAPRSRSAQPQPVRQTRTTTPSHPTGHRTPAVPVPIYRKTWVYSTAAAFLVLLAVWLKPQSEPNQIEVFARTPDHHEVPQLAITSLEIPAFGNRQVEPALDVSDQSAAPTTSAALAETAPAATAVAASPAPSLQEPEPVPATSTKVASATPANTHQPTTTAAPDKKASPDFRLQGIIYSSRPSAFINGQLVSPGDKVNGATVVEIDRTTVTLQISGERKTIRLR